MSWLLKSGIFCWSTNLDSDSMRKIGYCRVSTTHQNLDRQVGALRAERVNVIFRQKVSGKRVKGRPELEKAIDEARHRRHPRCRRMGSSHAINVRWNPPHRAHHCTVAHSFIAFLSATAEDERQRIVKRANDGRKVARSRGVQFGRKPKLTDHQQAKALKRLDGGESCRSIARSMAVHHATISRLAD
jgi:DNA invertase Pin-like site-specific DNA recombinase